MKQLYQKNDALLNPSFCIPPSDTVYNVVMTPNVAQTVAIPVGAKYVIFSTTANIWVNYNATSAIPTVSIVSGTQSELNPNGRYINGYSTISIIADTAAKLSLAFYSE